MTPSAAKAQRRKPRPRTDLRTVTLTVPLALNIGNARLHWRVKQRRKLEYYAALDALAAECEAWRRREARGLPHPRGGARERGHDIPPALDRPLPYATAAFHCRVYNVVDDDNLAARMKWLLDWCKGKFIAEDRRPHLVQTMPEQTVMAARGPRRDLIPQTVTLTFTEREAPDE